MFSKNQDDILVVDSNDTPVGYFDKMEVHKNNLLHRAFSVVIFNHNRTKMLLQQRALNKYHSGGLWSNACCSHEKKKDTGQELLTIATKRLLEEMGFTCPLKFVCKFHYNVQLSNGLYENEIDSIFFGYHSEDNKLLFNEEEVMDCKWIDVHFLSTDVVMNKANYTEWLIKMMQMDITKMTIQG